MCFSIARFSWRSSYSGAPTPSDGLSAVVRNGRSGSCPAARPGCVAGFLFRSRNRSGGDPPPPPRRPMMVIVRAQCGGTCSRYSPGVCGPFHIRGIVVGGGCCSVRVGDPPRKAPMPASHSQLLAHRSFSGHRSAVCPHLCHRKRGMLWGPSDRGRPAPERPPSHSHTLHPSPKSGGPTPPPKTTATPHFEDLR